MAGRLTRRGTNCSVAEPTGRESDPTAGATALSVFRGSPAECAEFALVLDLLATGRINAEPLITGVIGLDQTPAMFEALRHPGDHAKVLIDPRL